MRILSLDQGKFKTVACDYEVKEQEARVCDGADYA